MQLFCHFPFPVSFPDKASSTAATIAVSHLSWNKALGLNVGLNATLHKTDRFGITYKFAHPKARR